MSPGYNRSSCYHGSPADRRSANDNHTGTDPAIVLNFDILSKIALKTNWDTGVREVIDFLRKSYFRSDEDVVTDRDSSLRPEIAKTTD